MLTSVSVSVPLQLPITIYSAGARQSNLAASPVSKLPVCWSVVHQLVGRNTKINKKGMVPPKKSNDETHKITKQI